MRSVWRATSDLGRGEPLEACRDHLEPVATRLHVEGFVLAPVVGLDGARDVLADIGDDH
jgi:hypothetical protein